MNPYGEPETNEPLTGNDLFGNLRFLTVKSKQTERGELLKYFSSKLHISIERVAVKVTGIPTQDLYYLQSICDTYEREGKPWSKCFNGALKPRET